MMRVGLVGLLLLLYGGLNSIAASQLGLGTVRVLVPPAIFFQVSNVTVQETASAPVTATFDSALLLLGQALRISVRADGDLTLPGGPAIPATNVSWTPSSATNGVAFNGTLSKTVYTTVYQSNVGASSGSVTLKFTLAPPGAGIIRAGTRQAALRWRFEAVTP